MHRLMAAFALCLACSGMPPARAASGRIQFIGTVVAPTCMAPASASAHATDALPPGMQRCGYRANGKFHPAALFRQKRVPAVIYARRGNRLVQALMRAGRTHRPRHTVIVERTYL